MSMEYTQEQRDWARWNSGHKATWHVVKNKLPGRMGFTLCGHAIPQAAIEFTGVVPEQQVCRLCRKSLPVRA